MTNAKIWELEILSLILVISSISLLTNNLVHAQTNANFTKLFHDKYTRTYRYIEATDDNEYNKLYRIPPTVLAQQVFVKYESPTTILISGGLLTKPPARTSFNSVLWEAMDMLKAQYGFKLQQIMTSGVGSVGNPTEVYILMTK